jgi:hypothetical protein
LIVLPWLLFALEQLALQFHNALEVVALVSPLIAVAATLSAVAAAILLRGRIASVLFALIVAGATGVYWYWYANAINWH